MAHTNPSALPRPMRSLDARSIPIIRSRLAPERRRILRPKNPTQRRAAVLACYLQRCAPCARQTLRSAQRTDKVSTHKGQVAFPGGMVDATDRDLVHTALRETHEEIGIPEDKIQVLGEWHDAISSTGVFVTPVLGFLGDFESLQFHASPDEIDHIFAVTLEDLCDPEKHQIDQRYVDPRYPKPLKIFKAGLFPIWGLTAYLLDTALVEVLAHHVPPPPDKAAL